MEAITCPRCLFDFGRNDGDEQSAHTASPRCAQCHLVWDEPGGARRAGVSDTPAEAAAGSGEGRRIRSSREL